MGLLYIVGFHMLVAAATGKTDNFVATVYGPLPMHNAAALVDQRNGGGDGTNIDWTWRVAPPNAEYQGYEPPLQALEDSAVIQFATLGDRELRSMSCRMTNYSPHGEVVSATYFCNQFDTERQQGASTKKRETRAKASSSIDATLNDITNRYPVEAYRIKAFCKKISGNGAEHSKEDDCKRTEIAAWKRLSASGRLDSISEAIDTECTSPPFPGSYAGEEQCLNYKDNK